MGSSLGVCTLVQVTSAPGTRSNTTTARTGLRTRPTCPSLPSWRSSSPTSLSSGCRSPREGRATSLPPEVQPCHLRASLHVGSAGEADVRLADKAFLKHTRHPRRPRESCTAALPLGNVDRPDVPLNDNRTSCLPSKKVDSIIVGGKRRFPEAWSGAPRGEGANPAITRPGRTKRSTRRWGVGPGFRARCGGYSPYYPEGLSPRPSATTPAVSAAALRGRSR